MTTEHQILVRAREIIADPARWTQGELARKANGEACMPADDAAVCFCALGAIRRAAKELDAYWDIMRRAESMLYRACDNDLVTCINDHDGHAAVLALYDKAIEASKMMEAA